MLRRSIFRLANSRSTPFGARAFFSAAQSLPSAADFAASLLETPPYGSSQTDFIKSASEGRPVTVESSARFSTAAVASRLTQQTQFPLLPGTPFTVEGARLANSSQQARLVITPGSDSTVVFANPEWTKLTGYALHELEGTNGMQALTTPGTEIKSKQMIRDALERKTRVRMTIVLFHKDGSPLLLDLQLSPLLNKNGTVSHILACAKQH